MRAFKNQTDFLEAISLILRSSVPAETARSAILDGLGAANLEDCEIQTDPNAGQELRLGRWFIRNDDLPLFEALGAAATIFLSISTAGALAPSAIGSLSALAAACWKIHRKGARLSPSQVKVLAVLGTSEKSVSSIVSALATDRYSVTKEEVEEALQTLKNIELEDGTQVQLVRADNKGAWRAINS